MSSLSAAARSRPADAPAPAAPPVSSLATIGLGEGLGQEALSALRRAGPALTVFTDSDDFLLSDAPYAFDVYVLALRQRAMPGLALLRLLRRRATGPVIVLLDDWTAGVAVALDAGARMVLPPLGDVEDWRAVLRAVSASERPAVATWRLLPEQRRLQPPEASPVRLSESELKVLQCLAEAGGAAVTRDRLAEVLWGAARAEDSINALHATVYRLRKRIEQATDSVAPLQSVARVGYVFRAPLVLQDEG